MTRTILITGASGTVGRELIKYLKSYPLNVRVTSRNKEHPHTIYFDYNDPSSYSAALKDVDSVFILPPPVHDGSEMVAPFIKFIKEHPSRLHHIVSMTAMGTEPNDGTNFGKLEGQITDCGIPFTLIRPNWFMQNFSNYYGEGIKHHSMIALPAGDAKTSFVDTRDIGAVAAKVLAEEICIWESLTLTGGQSLTYAQTAALFAQHLGRPIVYQALSDELMRQILSQDNWDGESIDEMLNLFTNVREGQNADITQDVQRILSRPPHSLEQYIRDHKAQWMVF